MLFIVYIYLINQPQLQFPLVNRTTPELKYSIMQHFKYHICHLPECGTSANILEVDWNCICPGMSANQLMHQCDVTQTCMPSHTDVIEVV